MIGFCLDEGDKIFIEIGIENKKKKFILFLIME